MKKKTRNDIILAGVLLLLAAAGFLLFTLLKSDGDVAVVLIDGKEQARYPLTEDVSVVISAHDGVNTLVIRGGRAYIGDADCPDGICVDHSPVSHVGETIVCLPHKLVIKIESESSEKTLDIAV